MVDQGLAEFFIRFLDDLENTTFEWFFTGREDMVQHVSQLQSHAVFPKIPLEVGTAFLDKIIPVEEQSAEIVIDKIFESLVTAEDFLNLLLLLAGEEEGQALFHRIHAERVYQLAAEAGIVKVSVTVALQAFRQILPFQAQQRKVVVAKLGVQQKFRHGAECRSCRAGW